MLNDKFKEEADKHLSNDHRQTMRFYQLVHNGILLTVYLICFLALAKWWLLFLLILWDWNYNKSEKK